MGSAEAKKNEKEKPSNTGSSYNILTLAEYQKQVERFEKVNDSYFLPESFVIVRLDAHRFGPGWDELEDNSYPFSNQFNNLLIGVTRSLMCSGIRIQYSFLHGDEISLLLEHSEMSGLRRRTRLISGLSSAAAAAFCRLSNLQALFHAKVSELPSEKQVVDYFMWQRKAATRNYMARMIINLSRKQGISKQEINKSIAEFTEEVGYAKLEELGHQMDKIPPGLLYGSGCWWNDREVRHGRGSGHELSMQRNLPTTDEEYLGFLFQRLDAPAYSPNPEDGLVKMKMVGARMKSSKPQRRRDS